MTEKPRQHQKPSGRRPGVSQTRSAILETARALFGSQGFERTSIRAIAAGAGVDPSLVLHYFGSKNQLFREVVQWPVDTDKAMEEVVGPGVDGLGERLVRFFLAEWEDGDRHEITALIRSATDHEPAARLLAAFIARNIIGRIAGLIDDPSAELRAALICSTIVGLAIGRYVVPLEPLASAPTDAVVAGVGPTIQRYLNGDLDH